MAQGNQILIVHDDPRESFRVLNLLEAAGYRVFHASSGLDGLRVMADHQPALVLLKPDLVDVPGPELCKRIRETPGCRSTVILQVPGSSRTLPPPSLDPLYLADAQIDANANNEEILAEVRSMMRSQRRMSASKSENTGTSLFVRESGDRFHTLFDHARTGMALITIKGEIAEVNRALSRALNYSRGQLADKKFDQLLSERDRLRMARLRQQMLAAEMTSHQDDVDFVDQNGNLVQCNLCVTLVHDTKAKPSYFIAEVRDLTSRRTVDHVLKKQSDLFQSVLDSMVDGVSVADENGKMILHNPAALRILGVDLFKTRAERKAAISNFYYPDLTTQYPEDRLPLARAIRGESVDNSEIWVHGAAQTEPILISASARPLRDSDGNIRGAVTVFNDITKRKRTDEALEVQSQVLKNMTEGVSLTDREGFMLYTNPAMERMFGYAAGELTGQHVSILSTYASEENARLAKEISDSLKRAGVWMGEMSNRHKDGRIFSTFSRISVLEMSGNRYWVCVQEDITERKRTEEALRQSEERFTKIYRSSPVPIMISTLQDARILDMNDSCLQWLGYDRQEVMGHTMSELGVWQNMGDLEEISWSLEDLRSVNNQECGFTNKLGEPRDALINAELIELSGEHNVVWIIHDITERKKSDAQIQASLKEKEVLLQEIHHRVKNNLQVISSLLNLQSNYIKDDVVRELFRESQDRVKSMALIHEKLYQTKDLAKIDFSDYIKSLVNMLFQSYRSKVNEVKLDAQVKSVFLDIDTAIPVGLMINELVSNSLKHAFPDSRSGTISVDFAPVEDHFQLTVSDNGVGVPAGFDFEQSKSLGLRLVRILTNQLGGKLQFRSDGVTEFKIEFQDTETRNAQSRV